jgi:hypothetical protein
MTKRDRDIRRIVYLATFSIIAVCATLAIIWISGGILTHTNGIAITWALKPVYRVVACLGLVWFAIVIASCLLQSIMVNRDRENLTSSGSIMREIGLANEQVLGQVHEQVYWQVDEQVHEQVHEQVFEQVLWQVQENLTT